MYQLDKESRTKTGKIDLFSLDDILKQYSSEEDTAEVDAPNVMAPSCSLDNAAVLDTKWSGGAEPVLGVAGMGGTVRVYRASRSGSSITAELLASHGDSSNTHDDDGGTTDICLSLDWSNRISGGGDPKLVVSHLHGMVSVMRLRGGGKASPVSAGPALGGLEVEHSFKAHSFAPGFAPEVWIAAWNCHNDSLFCTGAEDGVLKHWDLRAGCSSPACKVKEAHSGSGVTTCQWHPTREHVFATGGYDDYLRLWDSRMPKEETGSFNAGGGVWRVKFCPPWLSDSLAKGAGCGAKGGAPQDLIAAACMRGGCHVVQTAGCAPAAAAEVSASSKGAKPSVREDEGAGVVQVGSYTGHPSESLAYGIDWLPSVEGGKSEEGAKPSALRFGSCSFYDREFHVWLLD